MGQDPPPPGRGQDNGKVRKVKDRTDPARIYQHTCLLSMEVWGNPFLREDARELAEWQSREAAEEAFGHDALILLGTSVTELTMPPAEPLDAAMAKTLGASHHTHVRITHEWTELVSEGAFLETTGDQEKGQSR